MSLSRVCSLEHWDDPELRQHFAEMGRFDGIHRKHWEIAHALLTLFGSVGKLTPRRRVLGVGAGVEDTIFHATRYADEVHATDLYAQAGEWGTFARSEMLIDPTRCAPGGMAWHPERLIVQHMDMCHLRYPDNHFDGVFSSGSIEHVGSLEAVAQAAREIARVTVPGGLISLSTEWRIDGPRGGWPGCILFDEDTLHSAIIAPSGCELVGNFEDRISLESLDAVQDLNTYIRAQQRGIDVPGPHVVLRNEGALFTSVHIVLRKQA